MDYSIQKLSPISYQRIAWGYGGDTSVLTERIVSGDCSEIYDSTLLIKVQGEIQSYLRDSNYTLISNDSVEALERQDEEKQKKVILKGQHFPIGHFHSIDGKDIYIRRQDSKIILLDFSYMGCEPCRLAIPIIRNLYDKYRDSGLSVWGIDPFDKGEKEIFERYKTKYYLSYPVLFSDKKTVYDYLGIEGYPTVVILDSNMNVLERLEGLDSFSSLDFETTIAQLLKK